jgi:2-dehydropantoate 2-reductase
MSLARIGPLHPDFVNRILRIPLLPELMALFFKPSLRGTYCSMSGDISHGSTEINAYNGHLLTLAGDLPCPFNRAAYDLITTMTQEGRIPERQQLLSLADQLPAGVMP